MSNRSELKSFAFCRSAAVDSSGHELNRNRLIALMAAIVLEEVRFSSSQLQFYFVLLYCLPLTTSLLWC